MKEHPILFSTPIVKAILDGRKTQTRRILNPQPFEKTAQCSGIDKFFYNEHFKKWWGVPYHIEEWDPSPSTLFEIRCPYGNSGDLLWVRETWNIWLNNKGPEGFTRLIQFLADSDSIIVPEEHFKWFDEKEERGYLNRPSIHLPKWATRIWLKIKDIRIERLQDISEKDSLEEGIPMASLDKSPIGEFELLWDSINKSRGYGWDTNPWVWVVEFERTEN